MEDKEEERSSRAKPWKKEVKTVRELLRNKWKRFICLLSSCSFRDFFFLSETHLKSEHWFFDFFSPLPSNYMDFALPVLLEIMVTVINTANCWHLLWKVMLISTGIVKPYFIPLTILTLKTHLALIIQAEHFCRSENIDVFWHYWL